MSNKIISAGEIGYDGNLAKSIERMIEDVKSGEVYSIYFRQLDTEPPYFLNVERKYNSDLDVKLEIETTKQQTADICSKLPEYLKKLGINKTSFINVKHLGERTGEEDLSYYEHIRYTPSDDWYSVAFCIPKIPLEGNKLEGYCDEIERQGFYIGDSDKKCILLNNPPLKVIRSESELTDEIRKYKDVQLYTMSNNPYNSSLWLKLYRYISERNHIELDNYIELDISVPRETSQEGPDLLGSDYLGDLLGLLDVEINPEAKMEIEKPGILGQTANRIKRFVG